MPYDGPFDVNVKDDDGFGGIQIYNLYELNLGAAYAPPGHNHEIKTKAI